MNDLSALNNAVKEQMNGLDLTMTSLKREPNEFDDDDDVESNVGSEDSNNSGSLHDEAKTDASKETVTSVNMSQGRTSRRKPAAPMWVNPHWEEEKQHSQTRGDKSQTNNPDEVIINGVCVMQTEDNYAPRRGSTEETVRVEPQAVIDRFDDDRSDASSVSHQDTRNDQEPEPHEEEDEDDEDNHHQTAGDKDVKDVKTENEEERWDMM